MLQTGPALDVFDLSLRQTIEKSSSDFYSLPSNLKYEHNYDDIESQQPEKLRCEFEMFLTSYHVMANFYLLSGLSEVECNHLWTFNYVDKGLKMLSKYLPDNHPVYVHVYGQIARVLLQQGGLECSRQA
ncbi:unnamed protein product [Didymodactylos carnosus]|uniref:Uncharacterized protein n=1 Tax=Didymodactylos carnosus TaxID=1234261 RepID=A0A8S2F814_9BILA|nr:unnamed protein product [Didymodactylos carnosus]CAF4198763.1 unnamed protein product [Didymodactylos carnosus]